MSLYIPKKIKVGFQKRSGTYTGKLAYVIYFDDKGVLRKEKSWEGWRDKKIEPIEFDNEPTSGFCLNKDIHRYSDWGSGRTVIRVYDPRDFEFEIATDNLIGILMHTDCLKRGLQGDFVYAWAGTELVLLPTCSDEYQNAVKFTSLQSLKVGAKEMKLGYSYLFKNQTSGVYLGKHNCKDRYSGKVSKKHIYLMGEGELDFFSSLSNIAQVTSQTEVTDEYMKGLEAMKKSRYLQEVDRCELLPVTKFDMGRFRYSNGPHVLKVGDVYFSLNVSKSYSQPEAYEINNIYKFSFTPSKGIVRQDTYHYHYEALAKNTDLLKSVYPIFGQKQIELKDLESLPFLEEYIIFKNGEKIPAYEY